MKRLGVIAAMAGELKPLVKGWTSLTFDRGGLFTRSRDNWEIVAVYGGMGREAAAAAFLRVMQDGRLDAVVSVGWAGGLSDRVSAGRVYCAGRVVDGNTGERYVTEDCPAGEMEVAQLVTMKRVVLQGEKRRVAEDFEAELVDMEAATVARLARVHELPFYCYKAVTDGVDEVLPDMNPYISRGGRMKMTGFVGSVVARPQYWPALMRMGRHSARGAVAIAGAVEQLATKLAEKRDVQ